MNILITSALCLGCLVIGLILGTALTYLNSKGIIDWTNSKLRRHLWIYNPYTESIRDLNTWEVEIMKSRAKDPNPCPDEPKPELPPKDLKQLLDFFKRSRH